MVRGPLFKAVTDDVAAKVIEVALTAEKAPPEALASAGGDIELLQAQALASFRAIRFHDMIRGGQKLASVLGCMRWQLLRFDRALLAYSDQPVVLWPLGMDLIDERPTVPKLGPANALEIRIPLSPTLLLLMTSEDLSDNTVGVAMPLALATETNALVIAQADRQWMHSPGSEPRVAKHLLRPISCDLNPA
jgi:hypothetical protein